MTKTLAQITAFALSALMTLGIVAGMNRIAANEYVAADSVVVAAAIEVQQVVVVGHRVDA